MTALTYRLFIDTTAWFIRARCDEPLRRRAARAAWIPLQRGLSCRAGPVKPFMNLTGEGIVTSFKFLPGPQWCCGETPEVGRTNRGSNGEVGERSAGSASCSPGALGGGCAGDWRG